MLEKSLLLSERLSRVLVWTGGVLIIGSALLVTVEVALRKLFNVSIGGADELSGYAFGVATTLGFSFALFERAHIRVDALFPFFPGWLRTFSNFLGLVLLVGFAGVVTAMAWSLVADTLDHGSRSITPMRTPLAIPQIPWLFGWLFFVFCGVLMGLVALVRLLRGDAAGANLLIGVKSVEEQIEDEAV
ncbi:TRAP transporter small permease [Nitratireductor sp. XY-223]|uniref:TRAP transporter small permease subunit n=1 Tax=Nitratireductor sp. XY-223 TaxID=2561926 RepID=UPI0010A9C514|nr:TRAP transporter small permease [Nitratireductor sp. XY-223]